MNIIWKFSFLLCGILFCSVQTFATDTDQDLGPIGQAEQKGIDTDEYIDNLGDPDYRPANPGFFQYYESRDGSRDKNLGAGFLITTIGGGDDAARAIVVLPGGQILAAGRIDNGSNNDFVIVRYHADGELDTSFSTRGKVTQSFGGGSDIAHALTYDTSGRYIVAGATDAGVTNAGEFGVLRLMSNGTLDTSFKTTGKTFTDFAGAADIARAVTMQTDGNIVAGGYSKSGSYYNFAVARYLSNGILDTSFHTNGMLSMSVGTSDSGANAVRMQTDGAIVLAGPSWNGTNWDFAVVRVTTNGVLDTSFNSSGKAINALITGDDVPYTMGIATDAKILLGGTAYNGTRFKYAVVRYLTNGTLDTSFNSSGVVTAAIGTRDERIYGLGLQEDGGVLAGGVSSNGTDNDFAIARYRSNGTLDTSFNSAGYRRSDLGAAEEVAQAIAMVGDQTIYIAGRANNGSNLDFAVTRYMTNGSLPFSGMLDVGLAGGKLTNSIGTSSDIFYSAAQAPDGKLVFSGLLSRVGANELGFAIARFTAGGVLDTSFRTQGYITSTFNGATTGHIAYGVIVQTDGKPVAAGVSGTKFALIRYNTNGTFDTSFKTSGVILASLGSDGSYAAGAYGIVLETGGKILIGGYTYNGFDNDFAIARFNTDGSFDTSFNSSGRLAHTISTGSEEIFGLSLQTDGRLVAVGEALDTSSGMYYGMAVARYTTDGRLDTSFINRGFRQHAPNAAHTDSFYGVAMDGNLVVAVGQMYGVDEMGAAIRYNSNGTLDTSFFSGGTLIVSFNTAAVARGVAVTTNRKYVIAGRAGVPTTFMLLRYNSSGVLDTSFKTNGKIFDSINANDHTAYGIIIQQDGKLVLPGEVTSGNNDFVIMRYWP